MRFLPWGLTVLIAVAALVAGTRWGWAFWIAAVFAPLALLGAFDFLQRRHTLWRNYPLVARVRWLFEDLRPYLRAYIVESDLEGRPFNHDQRALVYARAKRDEDAQPFGTKLDVYSDEYDWLMHSIQPAPLAGLDALRVRIGNAQCGKPYDASLLNVSAMSFGSLGRNAIEALNLGAKMGGFYHDTGEGGISPYHRKHGGDLVWELGSGYFGCRDADGRFDAGAFRDQAQDAQVKMVEIKLSQGAKPGHGGVLPGAKVTAEIAETRHIPIGKDCVSPAGHSAFSTPRELVAFAARLRELSGGKPVGIKLCVGQTHEVFAIMKAMRESGIRLDYIVVDGAEGGTGAAPIEFSNSLGAPLREGLILMRNALVGCGFADEIKLGASGKVYSAASMAMNHALGADWSNAARAFMFALGCVQSRRCHTGTCPTGVATQDPWRQRSLVVEEKAARVAQFQRRTLTALREITAAAGLSSPLDFEPHHMFQRLNPPEAKPIDQIYRFVEEGVLLETPEETPYAAAWAAADPDSFKARADFGRRHRAAGARGEEERGSLA